MTHAEKLQRIQALMDSPDVRELEALAAEVDEFERKAYPLAAPAESKPETCGTTHYAGCACHEQGWQNKWQAAIDMAARAQIEREELAGYLCRIKLPLPVRIVADLAELFPGENVRMKDEGGYLCIFSSN